VGGIFTDRGGIDIGITEHEQLGLGKIDTSGVLRSTGLTICPTCILQFWGRCKPKKVRDIA
jgi:hypothetical protein